MWVSFLTSLAVSNDRVSYGRFVLSRMTGKLSFPKCTHGDHSSQCQKATSGMGIIYFWLSFNQCLRQLSQNLDPLFGPWESSDLNYRWEVHIVFLNREDTNYNC